VRVDQVVALLLTAAPIQFLMTLPQLVEGVVVTTPVQRQDREHLEGQAAALLNRKPVDQVQPIKAMRVHPAMEALAAAVEAREKPEARIVPMPEGMGFHPQLTAVPRREPEAVVVGAEIAPMARRQMVEMAVGVADRRGTMLRTPHQDQRTPDQAAAAERVIHQAAQIITVRMADRAS